MVKVIRFCDTCDYCNEETGECENKKSRHFGGFMLSETACELYENDYQTEEEETLPAVREETALIQETGKNVQELLAGMRAMGEMMRVMNERMTAMEQTIRTLEKVTPGQAAEINKKIRSRAAEICREYQMGEERGMIVASGGGEKWEAVPLIWQPDPEQLKELAGAIRRDVREMTGVKTAREIARCDYPAVKEFIDGWDDYDVIRRIREKEREASWKK